MKQTLVELIAADDPNKEPDVIDDFGFHHPVAYLERVCWVLEASSFSFWPKDGGLDNQDSFLIDDVMRWFTLHRRLRWEHKHGMWRGPDEMPQQPAYNPMSAEH